VLRQWLLHQPMQEPLAQHKRLTGIAPPIPKASGAQSILICASFPPHLKVVFLNVGFDRLNQRWLSLSKPTSEPA
jgi:hypothetical protein